MVKERYELVQSVGKFDEGQRLEVTARFGGWHRYDVRLEPACRHATGSLQFTRRRLETVAERVTET
jgi:hypothetical protein